MTPLVHDQYGYVYQNSNVQAGGGVVADSLPELEYEESHNKVRALVKSIGGEV